MGYTDIGAYNLMLGFIGGIGATELVLILLLVLVLFGARKIPELAKGLGSGMREFKKAAREIESVGDAVTDSGDAKMSASASTPASETSSAEKPVN